MWDLNNFTGADFFASMIAIVAILFIAGYALKNALKKEAKNPKKYPWQHSTKWDTFRFDAGKIGLIAAMAFVFFAFSITSFRSQDEIPIIDDDPIIDISPDIPITSHPRPLPPPPPPPVIKEIMDIEVTDKPDVITLNIEPDDAKVTPIITGDSKNTGKTIKVVPPPPPPPPVEPDIIEIFKIVEQMPRFPGCENIDGTQKEKEACAKQKMLSYIYDNVKYPPIARENNVSGTVVIQFVVGKNGEIEDATIVRDIGANCGKEALDVVLSMNSMKEKWTPGKQRGRTVKVKYTLPIKFKLQG